MTAAAAGLALGSLCSGYGGLDDGVRAVLGGRLAWVADIDPGASAVLAHRYPGVPNLGDITAVDWTTVAPVQILTAGFPCTDVSLAGARAGLRAGTRSGIWANVAEAISVLRPQYVVLENVRGLLSAGADSDMEPCPWCLGEGGGEPALRALGAVLGDLAGCGYDAAWCGLPAAAVGAPHGRFRIFVLAWPAARGTAADPPHLGHQRSGDARRWGSGPADHRSSTAADPDGAALRHQPVAVAGCCGAPVAEHPGPDPVAHAHRGRLGPDLGGARAGQPDVDRLAAAHPAEPRRGGAGRPDPFGGDRGPADGVRASAQPRRCGCVVADAEGLGRGQGRAEPAGIVGGSDAADGGRGPGELPAAADAERDRRQGPGAAEPGPGRAAPAGRGRRPADLHRTAAADPDGDRRGVQPQPHPGQAGADQRDPDGLAVGGDRLDWGAYTGAVTRWEGLRGHRAPAPTIVGTRGQPKLNPAFVEWMMGLPPGWVTAVPGLTVNAQLKILGNGVVPQQAAAAVAWLLGYLPPAAAAAAGEPVAGAA